MASFVHTHMHTVRHKSIHTKVSVQTRRDAFRRRQKQIHDKIAEQLWPHKCEEEVLIPDNGEKVEKGFGDKVKLPRAANDEDACLTRYV